MLSRRNVLPVIGRFTDIRRPFLCLKRHYSDLPGNVKDYSEVLYDSSPRTIEDFVNPHRVGLLDLSIAHYLPSWMNLISNKDLSSLPPGYHFIFFPTSTSELDTLEDGYEKHFSPRHYFQRRLWTQGRLDFRENGLLMGSWARCVENVSKVVQNEKATDVWIERKMYNHLELCNEEDWVVKERRCLRYLRKIQPQHSGNSRPHPRVDQQLRDAVLKHEFTPSQILLTRFSYLTYNFHRIHIDAEYARTVELYPNTLVQGSLSITLILTIVQQFFQRQFENFRITSAKYVMYKPLYAENLITLILTPTKASQFKRAVIWDNLGRVAIECSIAHTPTI